MHSHNQAIDKLMHQVGFLQYKPQQLDAVSCQLQGKTYKKNELHLYTKGIKDKGSGKKYEQTFMK